MKFALGRYLLLVVCLAAPLGCASSPKSPAFASFPTPPLPKFMSAKPKFVPPPQPVFADEMAKGRSYETSEKLDKARKIYEQLIVDYPDRHEPYHRLAVVADRQKRYREAQGLYSEALRLNPNDPQLLNDLGYCFFLQGQLQKAKSALMKAVSMDPSNARYRNNLGLVYGHRGEYERALDEFRRAGSEADAQYSLAFILASQDDIEGAKDRFRLALASDPAHQKARDALRDFERFEKDPEGRMDNRQIVKDGVRYVPYVEQTGGNSDVQHALASADSKADVKTAGFQQPARRTLHQRLTAQSE